MTNFGTLGGVQSYLYGVISKDNNSSSHIEKILELYNRNTALITIIDAHSSSLAWIGSVLGHRVYPMGMNKPELVHLYDKCNKR